MISSPDTRLLHTAHIGGVLEDELDEVCSLVFQTGGGMRRSC
jgi:hypothetical protein